MIPLQNRTKHKETILERLNAIPLNTLFAKDVVEGKAGGEIFVDDPEHPSTFYILHPYGMSLLLGESGNDGFNRRFKDYVRNAGRVAWMQAYPDSWHPFLNELFPDAVDARVNFRFNPAAYARNRQPESDDPAIKVIPADATDFQRMKGTVIPSRFWNSPEEFMANGKGYSLHCGDTLASMAFSAYVEPGKLELGIETDGRFQGKGFAYRVCSALIDYCLQNGLEPIWACRFTNTGSYKLAQKLGFEEALRVPFYKIG